MLTLNDGRSELWQWDTNRKLTVDAECSQVHFSNKVFGRSIDVDVIDGVATIPDILLQTDKDLNVWAFVGTAENGYTKISKTFKVNRRNKPADYVFTPPEQTSLEEIKEKIEHLESIQDPDAIKNAVDDYLQNNPIQIDEKDPNVPEWAKQPNKPSYTADEVGALPDTYTPPVKSVNGKTGAVTLTADDVGAQPKGNYLTEVPEGYAKTGDIPTKPEDIGAQPSGNYLTEVPSGYATEEFVKNKIAEAELGGEEVDLSGYAQKSELPTKVSQLQNDSGYLTEHQDISGKLDASALPTAVNSALAQAKESGDFKGDPGEPGQKGEQGIQGIPGEKGDKGDKGDTGEKGTPGKDGVNGVTPHVGSNGNWFIGETDTGIPATGPAGGQGLPGTPGEDGKDGTSATHSWNGTVLTVTSASGTSSADLKGAKGDKGDKGDTGATGASGKDGKTPVKGTDYFTEADINEIVNAVYTKVADGNGVAY